MCTNDNNDNNKKKMKKNKINKNNKKNNKTNNNKNTKKKGNDNIINNKIFWFMICCSIFKVINNSIFTHTRVIHYRLFAKM